MKDKAGDVVYVGKAVNLRARVGQYFQERSSDTRAFIPFLEDLLSDVEVMITPSEKDAVLLENELIKSTGPASTSSCATTRTSSRCGSRTRTPTRAGGGPARAQGRSAVLRAVRERVVHPGDAEHREPPLPAPHLHRLGDGESAPALPAVPDQALPGALRVQRSARGVPAVRGGGGPLPGGQGRRADRPAADTDEGCGREARVRARRQLRDQLHAIERSLEKQRTVLGELLDQDVLGFHREGPALEIHLLFFRNGRLTGGRKLRLQQAGVSTEELLSSFLDQYYESGALIPKELLLPMHLSDAEMREVWLSEKKGERVRVHVPSAERKCGWSRWRWRTRGRATRRRRARRRASWRR